MATRSQTGYYTTKQYSTSATNSAFKGANDPYNDRKNKGGPPISTFLCTQQGKPDVYGLKKKPDSRVQGKQLLIGVAHGKQFTKTSYTGLFQPCTTHKFPGKNPYQTNIPYSESQPAEGRKKCFGSGDAKKRDEFMSDIRTEQYRETLKDEQNTAYRLAGIRKLVAGEELANRLGELRGQVADIEEHQGRPTKRPDESRAKFLYDNGRNDITPFNPKNKTDTYFVASNRLFYGDNRFRSATSEAYNLPPNAHKFDIKLQNGHRHSTDEFNDHGHLNI